MCCSLSSPKELDILTPWFTKPGINLGIWLGMGHISVVVQFRSVARIKNQRLQNTVGNIGKGWLMTTEPIHTVVESSTANITLLG